MSEIANNEGASEPEKPVDGIQFPPFPDPKDDDFDDDIREDERNYYKIVFKDLNNIKKKKLHCTACDRHLGCAARNEARMRPHPMLRTLVCHNCHIFYNSGEFEKGDDGSELYCRWCGQGGQVYCCSDCPHVFCAKCIKRNLGAPKIKEIENADDWKCFKCNSKCLWDLRALCWAVLRYCDLKNKIVYQEQDPQLKEVYKKDCSTDYSECCKHKLNKRIHKSETKKKEIKKEADVKATANIISKIPPTIQVKKFATMPIDDVKTEKKAQKRSSSPKNKNIIVKNPINITPCKVLNTINIPPLTKKMRLPNSPMLNNPVRLVSPNDRKPMVSYSRIRPKPHQLPIPIGNSSFNGISANLFSTTVGDHINLSLDSLTQGLDMAAVASISSNNNAQNDDVVCTPDFPLEPLCEVTEDNDDDVQCITPGPVAPPKFVNPPPLVPRSVPNAATDAKSDNIVQMTENDVSVNSATGGLKFRVDPQTLSSNKMYRLPDGRIFAINPNPNMPGGYSATIVAVTEPTNNKTTTKGATYAAKLSAVSTSTPSPALKKNKNTPRILKRGTPKAVRATKSTETSSRECDLNVPVEWYRYNLIDAVDALEYALSRLHKLKKEATTVYLRTRNVNEMRNLHRTLERLLNTSGSRFNEIRENLNKGLKQYVLRKSGGNISDDDDDVEILPDMDDNDDPIFIDENSVESTINGSENQEVDLTGAGSSEYNDSGENKDNSIPKTDTDPLNVSVNDNDAYEHGDILAVISQNNNDAADDNQITNHGTEYSEQTDSPIDTESKLRENETEIKLKETKSNLKENETPGSVIEENNEDIVRENGTDNSVEKVQTEKQCDENVSEKENTNEKNSIIENMNDAPCKLFKKSEIKDELNGEVPSNPDKLPDMEDEEDSMTQKDLIDKADSQDSDDKLQDTEMSEEMIETLLKDDNAVDEAASNVDSMDVSEVLQKP